jgi:phosphate transport system substrate-binding protein
MKGIYYILAILLTLSACQPSIRKDSVENTSILENINRGTFRVYADKNSEFLLKQLSDVFTGNFPEARIEATYLEEKDVIDAILKDSVRIILLQRELGEKDLEKIREVHDTKPIQSTFAYDAVVLAKGAGQKGSVLNYTQLQESLKKGGQSFVTLDTYTNLYVLVLRMLGVQSGDKSIATVSSLEELAMVLEKDPSKTALLPFALVSDEDDLFAKDVRKMFSWPGLAISNEGKTDTIYPSQSSIFTKEWPLVKTYTFLYCNVERKNGYGFVQFAHSTKAAKMILKAGLVPYKMPDRRIQLDV